MLPVAKIIIGILSMYKCGAMVQKQCREKNRSTLRETSPGSNCSTAIPIWNDLGSNPGLQGKKPYLWDYSETYLED
jgi:hypothetical protein